VPRERKQKNSKCFVFDVQSVAVGDVGHHGKYLFVKIAKNNIKRARKDRDPRFLGGGVVWCVARAINMRRSSTKD
jgi:hypothetical protein